MPLKYKYQTKAEVPVEHAALYKPTTVQANGASVEIYVLDVDGAADITRLNEFRDNNIQLDRKMRELETRFEGIDPVKARELMQIAGDLEEEKLLKKGEVDTIVTKRTAAMKEDYDKKLTKATEENTRLTGRLTEVEINQATVAAGTEFGLRPTAILDITSRARSIFKLVEGKVTAMGPDGKPIYGKDGTETLTIKDWVEQQVTAAPHLFEPNAGSGAAGGGTGGAGKKITRNPWKKESFNLTEQMMIQRNDPAAARRLKGEAGLKVD